MAAIVGRSCLIGSLVAVPDTAMAASSTHLRDHTMITTEEANFLRLLATADQLSAATSELIELLDTIDLTSALKLRDLVECLATRTELGIAQLRCQNSALNRYRAQCMSRSVDGDG